MFPVGSIKGAASLVELSQSSFGVLGSLHVVGPTLGIRAMLQMIKPIMALMIAEKNSKPSHRLYSHNIVHCILVGCLHSSSGQI